MSVDGCIPSGGSCTGGGTLGAVVLTVNMNTMTLPRSPPTAIG